MRPITRRQCRVLHREFLFRIVDRELLSSHARGDMSKLLLQIISLLIFVGMLSTAPAVLIKPPADPVARMLFGWTYVHSLISTTILVVGLFGVLSWNSMFPDRLDVHVLAPLPVRARTVLFAKIVAVSTGLGTTVLALHGAAGLIWPLWINSFVAIGGSRASGALLGFVSVVAAYWITVIAAAVFVFGTITSVQGTMAFLLPRRYFLRVSSFLQLATFAFVVLLYVIQPTRITPVVLAGLRQDGPVTWVPSFWFFGLLQVLVGDTSFLALAGRALWAVGGVTLLTAVAYGLSYAHMLSKIAEEPAIAPGGRRVSRLPAFGTALQTAVTQFSIRTLLRSPQHRVILAFYLGIGGAVGRPVRVPRRRARLRVDRAAVVERIARRVRRRTRAAGVRGLGTAAGVAQRVG